MNKLPQKTLVNFPNSWDNEQIAHT